MNLISVAASSTITMFGIVALLVVGVGFYWLVSKQARLKHLAELRGKLDELSPSDPEYGPVRALYTSMAIDAERWGYFHSSTGTQSHGEGGSHGGSDYGSDHSGGGGDSH